MGDSAVTIFGLSVLALLLAGYLGQQYLPPPKPRIVGIDLGTTYSCIGVYHAVTGEVEIIPDSDGHKTIPSIVAFTPEGVEVGYTALSHAEEMPESTIYDAKRFIGKVFSEAELAREIERYQFKINWDSEGGAFFQVQNRKITPQDIGGNILRELKHQAEKTLDVPMKLAVMAVPAEFDDSQRNATKQAAKQAGMEVLRIINEPTAAALAYGLHKREGTSNIVVIDMGGGTLDVSLLNVQGGMFQTYAMAGNNRLGGQDINFRLQQFILDLIQRTYHQRVTDPEDLQRLHLLVEEAKINLTSLHATQVSIPLPSLGPGVQFTYNLTRKKFEELNKDIFQKVLVPVKVVLETAEMDPSDIDDIVLVGGSTRIPRVREVVKEYFNKIPNTSIDPELAVVSGVALQAGILGGAWPLQVSAIELHNRNIRKINVQ